MAKQFIKTSVLSVGDHHSPDGVVSVTPQRLHHWQSQFKRLTANRQVVPMHWDHSDDPKMLEPISDQDLKLRKSRSAKNTVGRLVDFAVAPDGQSAQLKFETFDPKATDMVAANAVQISPVIMQEWKDGGDNRYPDVITHLDLVDHPVDHKQSPAIACALRMGLSTTVYRLASDNPFAKNDDDDEPGDDMAETADDDGGDIDVNIDADGAEGGTDPTEEAPETPGSTPADENPDLPPVATDKTKLAAVVAGLSQLGVVLPSDFSFDNDNAIDILLTAINTLLAAQQKHESTQADPNSDPNGMGGQPDTSGAQIMEPQMQTMSLQAKHALAYANRTHTAAIRSQLENLLATGRCTPAEFEAQKKSANAVKLSLDSKGKPKKSNIERWIASRKAIPAGTFWDSAQKLRMANAGHVVEEPSLTPATPSPEQEDAIVGWALNRKKRSG